MISFVNIVFIIILLIIIIIIIIIIIKFTKYEHYLNSPKNEEMRATEVTPYTVPLVEYEDEVGTSSIVNGIILGV